MKSIRARLTSPVYPGETLVLDCWRLGSEEIAFRARDGRQILTECSGRLFRIGGDEFVVVLPELTAAVDCIPTVSVAWLDPLRVQWRPEARAVELIVGHDLIMTIAMPV